MPCRPFLAASSRRSISLSLRKSLARSWPSVVGAGEAFWALLGTFRPAGDLFFMIITPDSIGVSIAYFGQNVCFDQSTQATCRTVVMWGPKLLHLRSELDPGTENY